MWFGHMERKKNEESVKKVYVNIIEGARKKGATGANRGESLK